MKINYTTNLIQIKRLAFPVVNFLKNKTTIDLLLALKKFCFFTVVPIVFFSSAVFGQVNERLTKYVDPFIGTGGHGHTFPGAVVPFGMVQLSPDQIQNSWDYCSGYHFPDKKIIGFSHTHLSGTGGSDYMDIRLQPTNKKVIDIDSMYEGRNTGHQFADNIKSFSEIAAPGYYAVTFEKSNIKTELTATSRVGFSKFSFPAEEKNIALDLCYFPGKPDSSMVHIENDTLITGFLFSTGWALNQKVYYAIRLSEPIASYAFSQKGIPVIQSSNQINGKYLLALLRFKSDQKSVSSKVSLSSVSIEGALNNLAAEVNHWSFNSIRNLADEAWEKELSHIKIESTNESKKKIFYTAYYHNSIAPSLYSDFDGQFRAGNDSVYKAQNFNYYTVFSLWDTYRAAHPFYTIVAPDKVSDFVQTMLMHYQINGVLPVWTLAGSETWGMHGNHSIPVITDAYLKGIKGIDLALALKAVKASLAFNYKSMADYNKLGFVPGDRQPDGAGISLEYYYDDWCAAQLFKANGNTDEYNFYLKRSLKFPLQYNSVNGLMQPRKAAGLFMEPFNGIGMGSKYGFTEGNAWQYSFSVQHNIKKLIQLFGGKKKFANKLDSLFSLQNTVNPGEVLDITGVIGLYAHGNEPCHHIPYLYNYVGQPWKSQKVIKLICDSLYTDQRDGLCGNDDCGQVSAWYLFSSMGFYPVNPASGKYDLGTPAFEKLSICLDNGKKFTVVAKGLTDEKFYVSKAILNGKELNHPFINHTDILRGGELIFVMSDKPNRLLWSGK